MDGIYFTGLRVRNIKGLKEEYFLDFSDDSGISSKWVVIVGNNNTGKTTFLRCIASMQLTQRKVVDPSGKLDISYSIPYKFFYGDEITRDSPSFIKAGFVSRGNHSNPNQDNKYLHVSNEYLDAGNVVNDMDPFGVIRKSNGSISFGYRIQNEIIPVDFLYDNLKIYGYGTSRRVSDSIQLSEKDQEDNAKSLFSNDVDLLSVKEWLAKIDYARKLGFSDAEKLFQKASNILTNNIFSGSREVRVRSLSGYDISIEIKTGDNWVPIEDLGYGYQTTMSWILDLTKRMFDRYPEIENPLHGPAIVLVDELDLHLHPEWQRKIIKYLSDLFPNTQFIVTAHSPLIVQSAENVNLIMLEKDDETGSINVRQKFGSFQGWTVEEILRELMDMGEKTRSDKYLELMAQFEDSLLTENYAVAKAAYDNLDKILSPSSHQRKVLAIQLSTITPVHS